MQIPSKRYIPGLEFAIHVERRTPLLKSSRLPKMCRCRTRCHREPAVADRVPDRPVSIARPPFLKASSRSQYARAARAGTNCRESSGQPLLRAGPLRAVPKQVWMAWRKAASLLSCGWVVLVVSFISTITLPKGGLCKPQTAVFIYQSSNSLNRVLSL